MTRAINHGPTVLAACLATSGSAEDLPVEKIVSLDQNTFKIRFAGRRHLDDAAEQV
jgi:hypothetical protein